MGPVDRVMVGHRPVRDGRARRALGGRVRRARSAPSCTSCRWSCRRTRADPVRRGGRHPRGGAADDLAHYAREIAGERGHAHVVIDDDPAMAIVHAAENAGDRRARRRQRRHGGAQGVPARQRPQPHQPQRALHRDHREHGGARREAARAKVARPSAHRRSAAASRTSRAGQPRLTARGAHIAAVFAKHGAEGAFGRPDEDGAVGRARQAKRLRAALEELGPTFAKLGQVLSTRPDLLPPEFIEELATLQDHVTPLSEEQVVEVMEQELGVPVGGRVRVDRPEAARRRHDRPGPPGHARERRPRGREGAAPRTPARRSSRTSRCWSCSPRR